MSESVVKFGAGAGAPAMMGGGVAANHSTEVAKAREMAEVQAAIFMARQSPRNEKVAIDRIMNACTRPTLAETAVYQYARGGSDVSGPSIRLAEAVAQSWGNLQYGVRELEQRHGESTCEAFAWDMETNTRVVKQFQVPHIRHTKRGAIVLSDPRDIYEMVANQGARRVRSCILSVVPGDVVEMAVRQCETTLATKADTSPAAQKKIVETFAEFGVTKGQIEARIQRRLDAITAAQVVGLRKVLMSLKDGMSSASEWFEEEEVDATDAKKGDEVNSLAGAIKKQVAKQKERAAASGSMNEELPPPEGK